MDQEPRTQCNANSCVSPGGNKLTTIEFYLYPTTSCICNSCIWTKRGWKGRRRSQRSCRASVENCLLESSALTYFQTICRWQLLPLFFYFPSQLKGKSELYKEEKDKTPRCQKCAEIFTSDNIEPSERRKHNTLAFWRVTLFLKRIEREN